MTPPSPPPLEPLSRDELQRIHRICCLFEDAWKQCLGSADAGPDFATLLVDVPEPERSTLFRELLLVDLEYRRKKGDQPTADEYLRRFPEETKLIGAVFADTLATGEVMQLCCPHCHSPIRLKDAEPDDVLCPSCGSSFRVRDTRLTSPFTAMRQLGKFQLIERLGIGSFGAVWRARDTTLDRIVAIKIPHAEQFHETQARDRFQREARAAAQLRHPGIVPVHEIVELETDAGTVPAIVSDFIEGATLRELLETRRVTFREAAGLIAEVAAALDYAHSHGIVHRDLKPANIMIEYPAGLGFSAPLNEDSRLSSTAPAKLTVTIASGTIAQKTTADCPAPVTESDCSVHAAEQESVSQKLGRPRPMILDFGLALRDEQVEATLTIDGQRLGAPAYMSPEQAAGRSHLADRRTDVWALGVILYELLCDDLPFRGSINSLLLQIQFDEPLAPRRVNDKIPFDLETITLTCLAKEPARRYATAGELAADLSCWLRGEPISARPTGNVERLWRWSCRNPKIATLSFVVLVLLFVVAAGSTFAAISLHRSRHAESRALAQAQADRNLAEQSFAQARQTVDYFVDVSLNKLKTLPGSETVRKELLEQSLVYYREFLRQRGDDPNLQATVAKTHVSIGNLFLDVRQFDEALAALQEATQVYENLIATDQGNVSYKLWLPRCYNNMALCRSNLGQRAQAILLLQEANRIREEMLIQELSDKALQRELEQDLATTYAELGDQQESSGQLDEARRSLNRSITILETLVDRGPQSASLVIDLAQSYGSLGILEETVGQTATALRWYQRAHNILQPHAEPDAPHTALRENVRAASVQGEVLQKRASALASLQQFEDAEATLGEAIALQRWALNKLPQMAHLEALYGHYRLLGKIQRNRGNHADAASTALQRRKLVPGDRAQLYEIACELAQCAALAGREKSEPAGTDQDGRQGYTGHAIATLREAIAAGFDDFDRIKTDPTLEPIRHDPAFVDLIPQSRR